MERQVPTDDPDRVEKGQRVGVAAGVAAGVVDQPPQGEMRQEQAIELLLGQIGPAAAHTASRPR